MAAELNFSEYQAIRRRHQREEEDDAAEDAPPPAPPTKDGSNEPTPSESWSERAGAFAELHETQLVMTLLIVADLAASTFLLLFDCHGTAIAAQLPTSAAKLLESFTGFTTFLFFFELCALVVAFQERFFLHPGYAIDVVVAALCLRAEIMLDGDKEVRLLGFLRLWRLSRLHETLNSAERAKTEEAEAAMIQEQERALRSAAPAPVFRESSSGNAAASRPVSSGARAASSGAASPWPRSRRSDASRNASRTRSAVSRPSIACHPFMTHVDRVVPASGASVVAVLDDHRFAATRNCWRQATRIALARNGNAMPRRESSEQHELACRNMLQR